MLALCWTLPPSLAAIAVAWVWLLQTRDRKLADEHAELIGSTKHLQLKHAEELRALDARTKACELHIDRLTDRAIG